MQVRVIAEEDKVPFSDHFVFVSWVDESSKERDRSPFINLRWAYLSMTSRYTIQSSTITEQG
ncbi:hypothetical protein QC762_0014490 [Podospora pseudocomata]|uniref:Uncharacterized protein n=1 Tax=Podospora pseudocomata TaxID=2093779 RepID=A0ABR0GW66_9PEZI|nr:hypothetical protein QC762_0014490 [Podospora pseudocomata]